MNQKRIGSLLSYITIFIKAFITILYTPVMIKFIGDAEFGVYNLTYSVISYLSLLSLGFGGAYVRFYYRFKSRQDEDGIKTLNGLFLKTYLIMAIVSFAAGIILVKNTNTILSGELSNSELELSSNLMKIMIINISLTFPDAVFNSYITANERFVFQRLLGLISSILSPVLGFILLVLGYRSIGLAISITLTTAISLILNIYFAMVKLKMKFNLINSNWALLKEIVIFSSFIFVNMIIDQLNWQIDKIILGKLVGSISVATYSIGATLNMYYMQFSTSVSNVFVPKVNKMVSENCKKDQFSKLMIKVGRVQFYVLMLILIGFLGVGRYFITKIWLNESYLTSYYIALILFIPITIPLIQNLGIEIQKAFNMHRFRSIIYLVIAILNVLFSIPLVKSFGEIGAAIGTGFATILGNVILMNWYYQKYIKINIIEFFKSIKNQFKGMIIPLLFSLYLAFRGINNNLEFLLFTTILITIYIISVLKFSLINDERKYINSIVNKLFN